MNLEGDEQNLFKNSHFFAIFDFLTETDGVKMDPPDKVPYMTGITTSNYVIIYGKLCVIKKRGIGQSSIFDFSMDIFFLEVM